MQIVQMLVGQMDVYAYLIGCPETKNAAVVDPGGDGERIKTEADKLGYNIVYIINTHGHFDHTLANGVLKRLTGAKLLIHKDDAPLLTAPEMRMMTQSMGYEPSPDPDEYLSEGQEISLGDNCKIKVLHTPGHSQGGVCLYIPGNIITGDTLFVGAVGRTDFPGGSWPVMRKSIFERILSLPDETVVWPGHHYGPTPSSTVAREKRTNPFLA